jgi:hypothetical protein
MIGIPLVTVCYLLTNVAYIAVVGGDGILNSGAVAMVMIQTHPSHLIPSIHSFFYVIFILCSISFHTDRWFHEAWSRCLVDSNFRGLLDVWLRQWFGFQWRKVSA